MTDDEVVTMIEEAGDFPSLSTIAQDIARMTSDLSAPVNEFADKIKSDQNLLNRVLKVVCSSFYGLADGVDKIEEAVSLIGYKKVCNLAVGLSIVDLFPNKMEG